jgi:hypothetical protein
MASKSAYTFQHSGDRGPGSRRNSDGSIELRLRVYYEILDSRVGSQAQYELQAAETAAEEDAQQIPHTIPRIIRSRSDA